MPENKIPNQQIEGKYIGPVKVGPKGQIVIPKEVRDMFEIKPGDSLVLLADKERGIAIQGYDLFLKLSDHVFGQP
ncbi:MAG: AbrB/MazE/SpoVT family DNA-binding domain-containing protein [Oscillospiraceae bacterium]